jgi:hypothetical protein
MSSDYRSFPPPDIVLYFEGDGDGEAELRSSAVSSKSPVLGLASIGLSSKSWRLPSLASLKLQTA